MDKVQQLKKHGNDYYNTKVRFLLAVISRKYDNVFVYEPAMLNVKQQ